MQNCIDNPVKRSNDSDLHRYMGDEWHIYDPGKDDRNFLQRLDLTPADIEEICLDKAKHCVWSFLFGAAGENALFKRWLQGRPLLHSIGRQRDHDASQAGDWQFCYKREKPWTLEVKTAHKNGILDGGVIRSSVDIAHKDEKTLVFDDQSTLRTRSVVAGEYDILAVNFWHVFKQHVYSFVMLDDLPRYTGNKIKASAYQKSMLVASTVKVSWPPEPPFTDDLYSLMDRALEQPDVKSCSEA